MVIIISRWNRAKALSFTHRQQGASAYGQLAPPPCRSSPFRRATARCSHAAPAPTVAMAARRECGGCHDYVYPSCSPSRGGPTLGARERMRGARGGGNNEKAKVIPWTGGIVIFLVDFRYGHIRASWKKRGRRNR